MAIQKIKIGGDPYRLRVKNGTIKKVIGQPNAIIKTRPSGKQVVKIGDTKKKFGANAFNSGGGNKNVQTVVQKSPLGDQTYKVKTNKQGDIKKIVEKTTLSGDQQNLLDAENALGLQGIDATSDQLGRVSDIAATPAPVANDATRQRVEDALYGKASSRLDPRFSKDQAALETQLANQGFARGSDGWKNALDDFSRSKNDAYEQAMYDAIYGGGQEQTRLLQNELATRAVPFNELAAISGTAGGATIPQFSTQGSDTLNSEALLQQQIAGQMALQNSNQQFQTQQDKRNSRNSLWDSILGLAGNVAGGWLGKVA